jgi:hypothetical protein
MFIADPEANKAPDPDPQNWLMIVHFACRWCPRRRSRSRSAASRSRCPPSSTPRTPSPSTSSPPTSSRSVTLITLCQGHLSHRMSVYKFSRAFLWGFFVSGRGCRRRYGTVIICCIWLQCSRNKLVHKLENTYGTLELTHNNVVEPRAEEPKLNCLPDQKLRIATPGSFLFTKDLKKYYKK